MTVFLSWSGEQSHAVARAFHDWLPRVIQVSAPWLSSEDISKGSSWPDDLQNALQTSGGVGVFFVTAEALRSQWLLFEAGRVAGLGHRRVCVVRVGLDRLDPPLGLFQGTSLEREDLLKLVRDLNEVIGAKVQESHLKDAFDWAWPKLEGEIKAALAMTPPPPPSKKKADPSPVDVSEVILAGLTRIEARVGGLEDRIASTDRLFQGLGTNGVGPAYGLPLPGGALRILGAEPQNPGSRFLLDTLRGNDDVPALGARPSGAIDVFARPGGTIAGITPAAAVSVPYVGASAASEPLTVGAIGKKKT